MAQIEIKWDLGTKNDLHPLITLIRTQIIDKLTWSEGNWFRERIASKRREPHSLTSQVKIWRVIIPSSMLHY